MMTKKKSTKSVAHILEDILGCKWSFRILMAIRGGTIRPGVIARSIDGLTTKVMNERLLKMVNYKILEKRSFAEIPPRVEYHFTTMGMRIGTLLDQIQVLQDEIDMQ